MTEHPPEPRYEPPNPARQRRPRKSGWRRAGRVASIAALSLLGLVVLAIVAALVWLHTGRGSGELGRYLANQARNAIQGDLRIGAIHVSGFLHICVDGVELRDPDGHRVVTADRACVRIEPLALRAHKVIITEAQLERPWIEIAKVPGTGETTLQRAIRPRKPPEPGAGGPFAWAIELRSVTIRGGSVTLRPEVGAEATFALQDFNVSQGHGHYSADSAAAGLNLSAELVAPGKAPVALTLETALDGAAAAGTVGVKSLRLKLGESGLLASGSWDFTRHAGEIRIRELTVRPDDLDVVLPAAPLEGIVRGEADLKSDGKTAGLDLRIEAGGGRILAKVTSTLEKSPVWDVQLSVAAVDPGAIASVAPNGEVTGRAALHGKGVPRFDKHGVEGELEGAVHVGPAKLERGGGVRVDLDASLHGRHALIRAFTATALGLEVKAHGAAAYDALSLDLDLRAPDLAQFGRAIGAITRKPSLPLSGAAHVTARVTGSPQNPNAKISLRSPKAGFGGTIAADGLAVDGTLSGPLKNPDGALRVRSRRLLASAIDLGAPRIEMQLQWPEANLQIDAAVAGGTLQLVGHAKIDEDKDGLVLSNFLVAYPGNTLRLAHDAGVHFRDTLILEPIDLVGEHGSVRLQAQIQPPPGRIDAAVVVTKFELDRLPEFAMHKDLELRGVLDANAVIEGPRGHPDIDVRADLHGTGAQAAGDLLVDGQVHMHVRRGVLQADGSLAGSDAVRLDFKGELPVQAIATQPPNAPIELDAHLSHFDVARLGEVMKVPVVLRHKAHGLIDVRIVATGTLAAPKATVSIDARNVGTEKIQQVDARAGLLVEKGTAALDASVLLGGDASLALSAQLPFDLVRAMQDPAYLRGITDRPLKAEIAITQLPLERLSKSGLLPAESAGTVSLSAKLNGTAARPVLSVDTAGENVTVGRLHGLGFQGELGVTDKVRLTLSAQSQGDAVAHLEVGATVSGAELLEVLRHRGDRTVLEPLLDRTVSLNLDIPGLTIARASELAGRTNVAQGRITGRVALTGTGARPQLTGQLTMRDLSKEQKKLGAADFYLEASSGGALLHVGVDPPGGGNFLGHVKVDADLGGRALLARGPSALLDGKLSGDVRARQLDLAFLSGLIPRVRRAGGILEGAVKVGGTVARPVGEGEVHLRDGLCEIVGQGVFTDLGMNATFSPKEVVIDRITGSAGPGTFSAILVASRRPAQDGTDPGRIEFTGEVHLGDAESVRDRKLAGTDQPLPAGAVPIRQAAEQRAEITGELDIFGDYSSGLLTVNAKIPDSHITIRQLPDRKLPSLKENPDVILVHAGERPHPPGREPEEVAAELEARKNATFRMHAHLDLNHLYVKAPDFEFSVESQMNFDYDARNPDGLTADGVVHVPSGSFSALQRRFSIDDARIIETGGDITDPELDIKALYESTQAKVTIAITGTAKSPQIEMSSSPPMDQDQIAFFLATGRVQGHATQQGGGVDLRGAATSVVGSLLFGQVRKEISDVLPVDVITIDSGPQGVSGASVGKYIGDKVFIGYRQLFVENPYENSVEGRIEYEISRSVGAEVTIGDRTKDFAVLYTKDF